MDTSFDRFRLTACALSTCVTLLCSCDGRVGTAPLRPGETEEDRNTESVVAVAPLRRLNRTEYRNTLADLVGADATLVDEFTTEVSGSSGFLEGGTVSLPDLERMMDAVDAIVVNYARDRLPSELVCADAADEDGCAREFLRSFARRAYRYPPSDLELADLVAVYREERDDSGTDLQGGVTEALKAALLSPRFHYRAEIGDEVPTRSNGRVVLNGYEVASRLSYFLWQSMPDEELLAAAAAGDLSDPDQVEAQARRLLAHPEKGPRGIRALARTWVPLEGLDNSISSARTAEDRALFVDLRESTLMFVQDLLLGDGDRSYAALLAGDQAFVNERTAPLFGLQDVAGPELRRVQMTDPRRAGLFTQPGFLHATSGPTLATIIHRGRFVFERLGPCLELSPPPGGVPDPPARMPGSSVREHLSEHAANPTCQGCHQHMDPMGYAFDGFDAMGRVRDLDDYGQPVDTSGEMREVGDPLLFADAAQLMTLLAPREASQRCFARQVVRFSLRSPIGTTGARTAADAFVGSEGDIVELLVAATRVPSFFVRLPSPGERF